MSKPDITLWTGQTIPRLGFGCWAIGGPFWADAIPVGWGVVDDNESKAAIAAALDAGIRFFDTADVYGAGHSEKIVGEALKGRNDVFVATKFGNQFNEDNKQITGKGGDPFDQVDRIPASNVVRIEIVEGTSLDIPGLSGQVANVITEASEGISGSWEWNPEWRQRQEANLLRGNIKASGETGNLTWAAELKNGARRNGDYGPETRRNADESIYEIRRYKGRYNSDVPSASANLTWKPTDDKIGNLNLEYTKYNFHRTLF